MLRPAFAHYPHFYVLNSEVRLPEDMQGRTWFITHSERDWKFLLNLWEAWRILRRESPSVILSTGAGPAVPFALVGRLLFKVHVIYVETITRISRPSLTGRLMYWLSHEFFYQHRSLDKYFPKGQYGGPLIK